MQAVEGVGEGQRLAGVELRELRAASENVGYVTRRELVAVDEERGVEVGLSMVFYKRGVLGA